MIDRSEVSTPAKNLYLEYEYLKHGIDQARKIYNRFVYKIYQRKSSVNMIISIADN
jgi:hypothetical protein